MEFRILGQLELVVDGRRVALAAAKPRALLAILLLHANESISGDRLIEELWAGHPPASAKKTLQTYVSRLRGALGEEVLLTRPAGYELRVESESLDLHRFERLVAEAREADPEGAARKLRAGLALWRGPPLADFVYEPFAQAEIARLDELRLIALEERIDADLALGQRGVLVAELERLVTEHPLRERLRGQLMLALYGSGRQAEALAVYRQGRQLLVEELGIEPSPALQQLEGAILRHEAVLEPRQEPEQKALAPPAARPHAAKLPRQLTSFVGRAAELAAVQALLQRPDVRPLTLTGPGGAGKTRLAIEAATKLRARSPGGVFFADLSPLREPALVAASIAEAVGLRELSPTSAAESLAAHLRDRKVLLVLDNFEHLLGAAPLVEKLLNSASELKLLVTSRAPLGLAREYTYPVPPLGLPVASTDLQGLAQVEAVALFLERAQSARPGFALTEANADALAELCVRLDGLPLALELAAARVSLLSPRSILARLGRWLDLLKTSAPGVPERHRTLRAAIEWSYELLSQQEQALFTSLGVFVGGFTVEGAEAVAEGLELDVLDGVETLLRASLLRAERLVQDEPRFGMLETIRAYALERMSQQANADELRRRHATFYLGLAEQAEPELCGRRQGAWLERLDAEQSNLRAGLAWAADSGDADIGLRLGAALWRFWQVRGHVAEGREQLERLLARRSGSPTARAAGQLSAARCAFIQGDFEAMERFLEASLPVHRRLGDDRAVAFALGILGGAVHVQGDRGRAKALFEEALTTARRAGDTWNESRTQCMLGQMLAAEGALTSARHQLEEGLRGARELGDVRSVGWALTSLAGVALAANDPRRARRRLEEALPIFRQLGDTWGIAHSLESLAYASLGEGDRERARELLEESLTLAHDGGIRPLIAAGLESFARLSAEDDLPERAARLYGCASVLREAVGVHPMQVGRPSDDQEIGALRSTLGDEAFVEAWAQGRAMTLDKALTYALQGARP
jgi:predicted ATPase/DNA-binding SARP family transcriptional activator